ncbi:MAG TPA: acetyltransferase [Cyclobacteriaceae bacterium]|nr:acetyltransferase [Cyclobacteriaceae bacterium]MCB9239391.1 acetyltransferase [Flammeovirgaceae bacterium]MCB0499684.1 acetyltransferase [Cyclobacteriaceae bacterium]MCO5271226.1 acetyltransferase [Cyclobacteriaceae bacterium]MCW5902568.1 acetyltransferase [Cyclobacteriaceae bacterium]
MQNPVIIFGANYLGRAAKEIFEQNKVVVYGFLDDDKKLHNTEVDDVAVLGATDDETFLGLIGKKCEPFVATDDNRLRKSLVKMLNAERKSQPCNAIHRGATVPSRSSIGYGNLIDDKVALGVGTHMGHHNIINAGATLGVGAKVGDFVQVGAGCAIGHDVVLEDGAFIGAGVTIVSGVVIGKGARVGAGSVVVASVGEGETVFGNPAQKVKS